MHYSYSATTGGFYHAEIHSNAPEDCVSITDELYDALMAGQSSGKRIIADDDGYPILADYDPPTQEQLDAAKAKEELAWRNEMLRQVIDGLDQLRNDAEFGSTTYNKPYTAAQLNAARVLLCDYPSTPDYPWGVRPTMPE